MKRSILFICLIILITKCTYAQIFCISDKQFVYPRIAERAGIEASFKVRFNVVAFSPENIQIEPIGSAPVEIFQESIIENLKRLTYFVDVSNLELILIYKISKGCRYNTDFAEVLSSREICFVGRQIFTYRDPWGDTFGPDPNADSVYTITTVPYKSGRQRFSKILVERIFTDHSDSAIIIENNYPELEEQILSIAKKYSKDQFARYPLKAKHYFIKFRVERFIPECDVVKYY